MDTLDKIQLKERICGTLLRLGWLAAIATLVPMLSYVAGATIVVFKALYMIILILIVLATAFLILLDEGFRNSFNSDSVDFMPMVQKVYQSYKAVIFVLLAIGIVLGVLTILLAVKENNGKSSKKRIISSSFMMAFTVLATIVYMATKSKVMGA